MQVTLLRENSDGSADFKFDLTAHEMEELLKFGIMEALKNAIKEGEKLTCEGEEIK
jgi:hypothetical protein